MMHYLTETTEEKTMRKLYFVSIDGDKWTNLDTGDERKARNLATEMYPQGIYGCIYIGLLEGDGVRKVRVRSPKINNERTHWKECYTPSHERVVNRARVWGQAYWLSVAGSELSWLQSTNMRAAKQVAARSALLQPGARVEIYCQRKNENEQRLTEVGDCGDDLKIKWRTSIVDTVTKVP
jgi:hypothetical protein